MQYATDFNLALELCINKIEGEELILSVDGVCQFLSDPFMLFLHLPKKKGASGSRAGWYLCLITTNASLQTNSKREQQDLLHRKQMPC